MKMCKQLMLETVISNSWESLEVRRIVRETKEGGVDRMEMIESELRMEREERECVSAILEEEESLARRLEKKERLHRAWRLGNGGQEISQDGQDVRGVISKWSR